MSHLSVQGKKIVSFFKPALLPSETSTTAESSIYELIYSLISFQINSLQ
jgi:hypothetical protein